LKMSQRSCPHWNPTPSWLHQQLHSSSHFLPLLSLALGVQSKQNQVRLYRHLNRMFRHSLLESHRPLIWAVCPLTTRAADVLHWGC
jgi:hypothetical protein